MYFNTVFNYNVLKYCPALTVSNVDYLISVLNFNVHTYKIISNVQDAQFGIHFSQLGREINRLLNGCLMFQTSQGCLNKARHNYLRRSFDGGDYGNSNVNEKEMI